MMQLQSLEIADRKKNKNKTDVKALYAKINNYKNQLR